MQLHGARSARRDKHRTHSFTFDVIATALQVVGVVVVHSRLVLFIAKLSLFLGRPWHQRALLIRTDEPKQSKWHR